MQTNSKWSLSSKDKERLIEALTPELATLRTKAEVSQEDLAELIGVSRQTYGALERGVRKMSWTTFLSLVMFYDCNKKTHQMLKSIKAIPQEMMKIFNAGNITRDIDLGVFLGEGAETIVDSLDEQAKRSIQTVIMVEYARCTSTPGDVVVKSFDGMNFTSFQPNSDTEEAEKALKKLGDGMQIMDSHEIKLKVRKFRKEFDIRELTAKVLRDSIERQGYTIVEYNHIYNDESVGSLIMALKLSEQATHSKCFSYADQNHRIVFLHEDLSDAEKVVVLSHEVGHIYLGHMSSTPILGRDVQEEYEANEFSHFLMNRGSFGKTILWICNHKTVAVLSVVILACLISIGIVVSRIKTENSYYEEYYITESGNKYHMKDCVYVKDKANIHRMTIEEYESGLYEPCGVCLP